MSTRSGGLKKRSLGRAGRAAGQILTRDWLLGVKRGWSSLEHPKIAGWADVFKVLDARRKFIDNLEEQVRYERPAPPYAVGGLKGEAEALDAAFQRVREAIGMERNSARHWFDVAEGRLTNRGEDPERGKKALANYIEHPESLNYAVIELRPAAKKRTAASSTRNGTVTELVDALLALLRDEAARIQRSIAHGGAIEEETREKFGGESREFDLHGMKVVIVDKTVRPWMARNYAEYMTEAYRLLQAKGLSKVWYGTTFIKCENCGGVNPNGRDFGVGGDYPSGPDVVNVYVRPLPVVTMVMVHELGHRYWFKKSNEGLRARFAAAVKVYEGGRVQREELYEHSLQREVERVSRAGDELLPRADNMLKLVVAAPESDELVWDVLKRHQKILLESTAGYGIKDYAQVVREAVSGKGLYDDSLIDASKMASKVFEDRDMRLDREEIANHVFGIQKAVEDMVKTIEADMDKLMPRIYAAQKDTRYDRYALREKTYAKVVGEWVKAYKKEVVAVQERTKKFQGRFFRAYNDLALDDYVQLSKEAQLKWEKDPRVPAVSEYGKSNIDEAFAEAFTHYVLGRDMTRAQIQTFKEVLVGREGMAAGQRRKVKSRRLK